MQLPPSVYKNPCPPIVKGESAFGHKSALSPGRWPSSKSGNFSLHQPCLLSIVFWTTSSWAWFSVTEGLGEKLESQAQPLPIHLRLGYLVFKSHMWWWGLGGGLVVQSSLTLGDPLDSSLTGFSVCEIFQARILEWVAISFSTVIHIKQINFTKGRKSPVSSVLANPDTHTHTHIHTHTHTYFCWYFELALQLSHYTQCRSTPNFFLLICCPSAGMLRRVWLFPIPCSSGLGTFQTTVLEWVAISSSRGSSHPRDWTIISCVSALADGFFTTEPKFFPPYVLNGV